MHVSTLVRRCSALLVVLVAASACSDTSTAPRAPQATERPAFDIQALQPLEYRGGDYAHGPRSQDLDSNTTTLTIDPNVSRTYAFGENWIHFPAHSICDPATSGYGEGLWDAPCTAVTRPVTVTIKWSNRGGYAYAQFSPALRFVPADAWSVTRWVILSLNLQKRVRDVSAYNILYCAGDNVWVDESLTDKTLRAWLDPLHNSLVRRVKHFSGYMVAAGMYGMGGLDASY